MIDWSFLKEFMDHGILRGGTLAVLGRVSALPAKTVRFHEFEFVFSAAGTVKNVHCNLRV